jgi:hypothetical protein
MSHAMCIDHQRFREASAFLRYISQFPESRSTTILEQSQYSQDTKLYIPDRLGVDQHTDEASVAIGDACVVLFAYQSALGVGKASSSEVRSIIKRINELSSDLLTTLDRRDLAAIISRHLIEQSIIKSKLINADEYSPPPNPRSRQTANAPGILRPSPFTTSGRSLYKKIARINSLNKPIMTANSRPTYLSIFTKKRQGTTVDTRLDSISSIDHAIHSLNRSFLEKRHELTALNNASRETLDSLPEGANANTILSIMPKHVLTWGCVELVEAWRPGGTRPTYGDNSPCGLLISLLHSCIVADEADKKFNETFLSAINNLTEFRLTPLLFDGKHPIRERLTEFQDDPDDEDNALQFSATGCRRFAKPARKS